MSGAGSSCGACKFLRRRCRNECVFAPYFCYSEAATHFAAVHKVFGASNVSKLLQNLPVQNRREAAVSVSYEAVARMQDPVYGCVGHIFALQQQVVSLREEIDMLGTQMAGVTVGAATCATSQAIDNQHNGLQLSSQPDAITVMQYYLNQQPQTLPHTANTTTNQFLDVQTNEQFPSLQGWEDHNLFLESESCSLEGLLEGMDQDTLEFYPWLDNDNNAER